MKLLEVRQLTMRFGGLTAVSEVDFSIAPGEIMSLIGPNGAGKTTVFNAVTGVYTPSGGKVLIEDREMQVPFSVRAGGTMLAIGAATGLLLTLLVNLIGLWDAAITTHYVYQEPFPWGQAAMAAVAYLRGESTWYTWGTFAAGLLVGSAAAYSAWWRARRTPEVVARHGVIRTFQNIRLFARLSVLENILVGMDGQLRTRFGAALLRLPAFFRERRESTAAAMELLKLVGLEDKASTPAGNLSYGDQRRVEIVRALAARPRILLLDEPAAGMNPAEAAALTLLIRKIRERGVTILLIEHHMKVVMDISDHITVLDYGHRIAAGTPDEVRHNPRVIEAYLGREGEALHG